MILIILGFCFSERDLRGLPVVLGNGSAMMAGGMSYVVWCSAAWCGVVKCGMECGMWCSVVQCWCGVVLCGLAWR